MSKSAWENYWSSGRVSCFPDTSVMDSQLCQLWQQALKNVRLQVNGDVLELGCGNGFLTKILLDELQQQQKTNLCLNLLDYAQVQLQLPELDAIQCSLMPDTAIEAIPLLSATQQLIVANFAFEYADRKEAVSELSRLLVDGGVCLLNIHARSSVISVKSRNILNAINMLLEHLSLTQDIHNLVILKAQGWTQSHKAEFVQKAKQVLDGLKVIDAACNGGIADSGFIDDLLPFINSATENKTLEQLEGLWSDYRYYAARIEQQLNVGLDEDAIQGLIEQLSAHNIQSSYKAINQQQHTISYFVSGIRANR